MLSDLCVGEFLRVNNGGICFDDSQAEFCFDEGQGGNNFVGFAEEQPCYFFSFFFIRGFADDSAIEIDEGIGADDEIGGVFFCDVVGF